MTVAAQRWHHTLTSVLALYVDQDLAGAAHSMKRLVEVIILVHASVKNAEEMPIVPVLRAHCSVRRFAGR